MIGIIEASRNNLGLVPGRARTRALSRAFKLASRRDGLRVRRPGARRSPSRTSEIHWQSTMIKTADIHHRYSREPSESFKLDYFDSCH